MPIYSYRCMKCNEAEEATVPVAQRDAPRKHSCGGKMKRELSLPQPPIMVKNGKDMALNSLNSGGALPDRWYKKKYENLAKKGLERPPKSIW